MKPPEVEARLAHILEAGQHVLRFTAGKTFDEYVDDTLVTSAVERQLMIVGEAVTRIARSDAAAAHALGDFPRIIAFRNQLVHNYPNVDDTAVWFIVQREIPVLLERVRALLETPGDLPA